MHLCFSLFRDSKIILLPFRTFSVAIVLFRFGEIGYNDSNYSNGSEVLNFFQVHSYKYSPRILLRASKLFNF